MLINKKTLEYLAELSRIELEEKSEEKLLKDLQKILAYFEELKEVDTENIDPVRNKPPQAAVAVPKAGRISNGVEPMAGGTIEKNVFREDDSTRINADQKKDQRAIRGSLADQRESALLSQFPEKENGFLKIPPIF